MFGVVTANSSTAQIVTAVGACVAAAASLGGLLAIFLEVRLDHKRRRNQATIDTWVGTSEYRRTLREAVTKAIGSEPLDDFAIEYIEADQTTRDALRRLLGGLEHVALGVNTKVFDFKVLDRLSGSFILRTFANSEPFIKNLRSTQPTAYSELEVLAKRIWKYRNDNGTLPTMPREPSWAKQSA